MTDAEIAKRRDEVATTWGPWELDNLRIAPGVFTMGEGQDGSAARVRRTVQTILDLAGPREKTLRVLDLACGEGGLALELGRQGFEVVGLEGQAARAERAEFARDALGLTRVTIVHGDVRRLTVEEYGYFDVVVAMGILDRLDAPAILAAVKQMGVVCTRFALIEGELAPRARVARVIDGVTLRGTSRPDKAPGFLLNRISLLGLLARSGFTSIADMLDPSAVPGTPCFAAFKGRRAALLAIPQANALAVPGWGEG